MASKLSTTLQKRRQTKSVRIAVLVVLLAVLIAMYFLRGKMKGLILVLIVIILSAIGLQLTNYDLDLATLWQTGSIQASRVEYNKGYKIIGAECASDNLNCADFATQSEAQSLYETCASKIAADNKVNDTDTIKNIDVYGLDGDKDGIVCEHLPVG